MLQPFAQVSSNMLGDLLVTTMQEMTAPGYWVRTTETINPKTKIENIKQEKPPA
jgi:hypothetical protein